MPSSVITTLSPNMFDKSMPVGMLYAVLVRCLYAEVTLVSKEYACILTCFRNKGGPINRWC